MRIKNYFLVAAFFIFSNCEKDFLNVVPDNIATIDLAFNNRATAERFFLHVILIFQNMHMQNKIFP